MSTLFALNCQQFWIQKGSRGLLFFGMALFGQETARAQYADRWDDIALRYEDHVYDPDIHTVLLHPVGNELGFPALPLGRGEQLELRFDDLSSGGGQWNYTFVHCNAKWEPSDLQVSQYLSGYRSQFISDIRYSFNTFVPYSHYRLRFPNRDMNLLLSGNYVLIVYDQSPDQPLLTRRFMVYEDLATFSGRVTRSAKVDWIDTHHEVDFALQHAQYPIPQPFEDLDVFVLQNGRWDNAIAGLKPRFVRNLVLDYNYDGPNNFPAGNEWRNFDTKNDQSLSLNVRRIELKDVFTFYLSEDVPRNIGVYSFLDDIDGRRVVRKSGSSDPHIEADYAWVDFALRPQVNWTGGSIYVYGALSDWMLDERFRLEFDPKNGLYRAKILLKQGYCDYQYAVAGAGPGASTSEIEGDRWETRNSYQLLAYYREVGLRYDRLIAFSQWSSAVGL